MAVYIIEEWLAGMVDFDVPESTMRAILFNNGVAPATDMTTITEKQKDLCLADLYMWLAGSSSASSGEYVSDGGWQHQKANKSVVDRSAFRRMAEQLYAKWESDKASTAGSGVTIKHLY